jgi:hypothetical protein
MRREKARVLGGDGVELTVGIYEEITGETELPSPVTAADHDRRKHRRVPFGQRATITTQRKGVNDPPSVVMVRDVSVGGLSFLNAEPVKPGTPFVIEFRGHRDRTVKFRCLTKRCEAGGSGGTQFIIGATFEQMLTAELPARAPQQSEEEQHQPVAATGDSQKDLDIEIDGSSDASGPGVSPDIEAAIAAALEEAVGAGRADGAEAQPEPEKPPEAVVEPLSAEDQQKLAARLRQAEPVEEKKPLVATAPATVAPAAPVKQSGLFIKSAPTKSLLQYEEEWGGQAASSAQPEQQTSAAPSEEAPVFRVILLPDPPAAAAEMELGPAPAPVAADSSSAALPAAPDAGAINGNEILARVKEVLLSQERTIKAQRQQIAEDRQRTTRELESLRAELAGVRQQLSDIQARKSADDRAIADLAAVLATCEPDSPELATPEIKPTDSESKAA